jgi:hypothetical protein
MCLADEARDAKPASIADTGMQIHGVDGDENGDSLCASLGGPLVSPIFAGCRVLGDPDNRRALARLSPV